MSLAKLPVEILVVIFGFRCDLVNLLCVSKNFYNIIQNNKREINKRILINYLKLYPQCDLDYVFEQAIEKNDILIIHLLFENNKYHQYINDFARYVIEDNRIEIFVLLLKNLVLQPRNLDYKMVYDTTFKYDKLDIFNILKKYEKQMDKYKYEQIYKYKTEQMTDAEYFIEHFIEIYY